MQGRHENQRRRSPLAVPAALLSAVLAAWGTTVFLDDRLREDGCAGVRPARIAMTPPVAVAVRELLEAEPGCLPVEVVPLDSAAMADALLNPPTGGIADAWLPGSGGGRNALQAFFTSEQAVLQHNASAGRSRLQDPRQPLPVIFVGIGKGVDPTEFDAVAKATGGRVFLAARPGESIRDIFFGAVASLLCPAGYCPR